MMHKHHILPRKAPYMADLHHYKEDPSWHVSLTVEGHVCQHDVLHKAFGWDGDKWAAAGLGAWVGSEELLFELNAMGGRNGSKTRAAKGQYGLGHCHVTPVIATNKKTGEVRQFESCKQAADVLGLHASHISECSRNLPRRKSTGGWTFRRES